MSADTKPTVYEAWSAVMVDVMSVGKTGHNKQQNYNFRGIDAVVNAAGPAMREHGVIVVPSLLDAQYRDIQVGQNRTSMREVTVKVRYTVFGPAGDVLTVPDDPNFGVVPGESMDSGDKGTAKAMSVAYRIFLLQALTIPTSEPDPDESSYERSAGGSEPALAAGELTAKDAKGQLLEHVQGDKDAATAAWTAAGLDGRWKVTAVELALAIAAFDAIAGSATTGEGVEPEPPGSAPDPDEKPGPATELRQKAEAIAAEAAKEGSS